MLLLSRQTRACRDKYTFVATKHVFCRDKMILMAALATDTDLVCLSVDVRAAVTGGAGTMVVMTSQPGIPVQGGLYRYGQVPAAIVCQHCNATVTTSTMYTVGSSTWVICLIVCIIGSVSCVSIWSVGSISCVSSSGLWGQYRVCLVLVYGVSIVCVYLWFVGSVLCVSALSPGLWGQYCMCPPYPLVCGVSIVCICVFPWFVGSVLCMSALSPGWWGQYRV